MFKRIEISYVIFDDKYNMVDINQIIDKALEEANVYFWTLRKIKEESKISKEELLESIKT